MRWDRFAGVLDYRTEGIKVPFMIRTFFNGVAYRTVTKVEFNAIDDAIQDLK